MDFLSRTGQSLKRIELALNHATTSYDHFPSLAQLSDCMLWAIQNDQPKTYYKKEEEQRWVSTQCPGMPAAIEALCIMIKEGRSDHGAFHFGLKYTEFTPQQMWEIYEDWAKGVLNQLAKDYQPKSKSLTAAMSAKSAAP